MPCSSDLAPRVRGDRARLRAASARWGYWLGVAICGLMSAQAVACPPVQEIAWREEGNLRQQLNERTQINWNEAPLRSALDGLAENQRIAIFLDRRVDPDQQVKFASGDVTVEEAIDRLTDQLQLTYYLVGNLIYIAHPDDLDAVVTALEARQAQLNGPLRSIRTRWMQPVSMSWEQLSSPSTILQQLEGPPSQENRSEEQITLRGTEELPHDLWPARQWPRLTRLEAVSLIVGGFDLGLEIQSDGVGQIGPLDHDVAIERTYRLRADQPLDLIALRDEFPRAEIREQGRVLQVTGSMLAHRMIDRIINRSGDIDVARRKPQTEGRKVYTIRKTTTAAGNVVTTVAGQLKVQMRTEGTAAETLKTQITIEVSDATLDELMSEVLDPLGLNYQLTDQDLIIRPK